MRNIKYLIIASMITCLAACVDNGGFDIETSCFQVDLGDTTTYQLVHKWIFLGFLYTDTQFEECKSDHLKEMYVEFSDTNTFFAQSVCNTFMGKYYVSSSDSISIDSLASTYIYCSNDTIRDMETKYFEELKKGSSFEILGNRLTIQTNAGIDIIFRAN